MIKKTKNNMESKFNNKNKNKTEKDISKVAKIVDEKRLDDE